MRIRNEAVRQEIAQPDVKRPGRQQEKVNDCDGRRGKPQIGKQAVEREGEIGVMVCGVVVRTFLEGILERVAVETDGPVRQTVEVPVRRHIPQ